MATEPRESKLKLIHLVYLLVAAALGIGLYLGAISNQQETNTGRIEHKVEKEIFDMHQQQQNVQMGRIDKTMGEMNTKLDSALSK